MAMNPYFEAHPYDTMAPWMPAAAYSKQYHRPWHSLTHFIPRVDSHGPSDITLDKDKFQVCLDVHQFAPSEITVKTKDRHIIVEGKHDEKEDEHGSVSRHFVRKYLLPEGHHSEDVTSTLSSDGILCITGPKRKDTADGERIVSVSMVGPLHGVIKSSSTQENVGEENIQQ